MYRPYIDRLTPLSGIDGRRPRPLQHHLAPQRSPPITSGRPCRGRLQVWTCVRTRIGWKPTTTLRAVDRCHHGNPKVEHMGADETETVALLALLRVPCGSLRVQPTNYTANVRLGA